jgi:uncharacterized protein (TIGR02118 family)
VIKLLTFLKRGGDLSRSGFEERWLGVHAPLAARFPGLRGYTLGFSIETGEPRADGLAQLWFDSPEACQASYATDIGRNGSADANAYVTRRQHILASEEFLTSGARERTMPCRLVLAVKRRDGESRPVFLGWLRQFAARDIARLYPTHPVRLSIDETGQLLNSGTSGELVLIEAEGVFDGLVEIAFGSADALEAGAATFRASRVSQALADHVSGLEELLLREEVVVPPPPMTHPAPSEA